MATINIYTKAEISMPGCERVIIGSLNTPYSVTLDVTSPDYFRDTLYLADGDEVTVLELGSGLDMDAFKVAIFKPSVAMYIGWRGSNSDADNSCVEVAAGSLFTLTSDATTDYNSSTLVRVGNTKTAYDISAVYAGNRSGGTGKLEVWAVN